MADALYMTQRWGHHRAEGNVRQQHHNHKVICMKVFLSAAAVSSFSVFGSEIEGSFACGAQLVPALSGQERNAASASFMACFCACVCVCVCVWASTETQLESLLYPRDERSATWAFPCSDLAPFGDSESCTHVHISHNNTAEALETACAIHTPFSQPSTERTFVSLWQMVFRILANLPLRPQVRLSQPQAPRPPLNAAHQRKRSFSVFAGLALMVNNRRGDREKLESDSKRLCSGCTQTASCALAFPSFPPSGTRVHPDSSSLTANAALCHGVHWLSYLPIYHSWIGTSLAWNLLSDFVRVTWDAWCCNCSAFGNGGSVANVLRVILTYLLRLVLQFTALWWIQC